MRNERDVYMGQYPERVELLKKMGFEWEHSAVPDEWDTIILGKRRYHMIFIVNFVSKGKIFGKRTVWVVSGESIGLLWKIEILHRL